MVRLHILLLGRKSKVNVMMAYYDIIGILFIFTALTTGFTFPESTAGIELPSGNEQFHRVYASGYLNYICNMTTDGSWKWLIAYPVAVLRRYDESDVNPAIGPVVGHHEHTMTKNFTVDTAVWTLGVNCNATTCETTTDKLFGTPIKKVGVKPNQGLPDALLQTLADEPHTGPIFQDVTYIQRIDFSGGVVPITVSCDATNNADHYNVDFGAHYIFARKTSSISGSSSIYLLPLVAYISVIHPLIFL